MPRKDRNVRCGVKSVVLIIDNDLRFPPEADLFSAVRNGSNVPGAAFCDRTFNYHGSSCGHQEIVPAGLPART